MTAPSDPVTLRLPAGPICWLYPALLDHDILGHDVAVAVGADDDSEPFATTSVDASIADLARRGIDAVRFEDGPRAAVARERLGPHLRRRGIRIAEPSRDRPSLERRLATSDAPGLLALRPGADLERQLDDALAAPITRPARVPFFVTDNTPHETAGDGPPTTRLSAGWWGIVPGDHYPAAIRARTRALVRRWHPERYFAFLALENLALAGVDAYGDALLGRSLGGRNAAVESRRAGAVVIAVDGIDGAGKSSHIEAIRAHLAARGLRVTTRKMYRHGVFHETITDVTRQCRGERNLHLWRLQRLVKVFDSVKFYHANVRDALASHDVVLFDRYIHTHLAAGVGRYHHDPYARELLSVYPPADRVYLLHAPVARVIERLGERAERTVDENPYMLGRFADALDRLSGRPEVRRIDATRSFDENRATILADVDALLDGGGDDA